MYDAVFECVFLMQKLLGWKMAEFKIVLQAVWSQDRTLEILEPETELASDETQTIVSAVSI